MPYELSTISEPMPSGIQPMPQMREEKEISMYGDGSRERLAQAMAKVRGETVVTGQSNTNDNASAAPDKSAASLPLSPQVAALARKEQKYRQDLAALKSQRDSLESERKEISDLKSLKAKIASGDYSEIDKLVDYEKLVQHKLGKDPKSDELDALKSEIAKIKSDREQDATDRFESAINQRRVAVKSLIDSGDSFPKIKELKAQEAVVQHIIDTWDEDSVELTPEEAAKEIEEAILAKANKWAALAGQKVQESSAQVQETDKKELPPLKNGMKTLTQNMAATGEIKRPQKPLHLMNEDERYKEARRRYEEKIQMRG